MAANAHKQSDGVVELSTPIQFLKGVGPDRAHLLAKLGLRTASDLLFQFPRSYQDMSAQATVAELEDGQTVSIVGTVAKVGFRRLRGWGKSVVNLVLQDGTGELRAAWFNLPFMKDKFAVGQRILLSGAVKLKKGIWEMSHPRSIVLNDDEEVPDGEVLSVYPLTDGINQTQMRKIIAFAVENLADELEEVFPESVLNGKGLLGIIDAVQKVHSPTAISEAENARARFVYQELLVLQLALALQRWSIQQKARSPVFESSAEIHSRITRRFPFKLTKDQQQVIQEITEDTAREYPMNRLLQGDVGSGKTVVAEYAMLLAVANGHQAVLMAPTEILAQQHLQTLSRDLKDSRVRIELLTGSVTGSERKEILEAVRTGQVDLLIGTHAVSYEHVVFANLGLVVIDEQHKFGVKQRASLKKAGVDPHYLVMTATPIPRTVTMTLFGDLDVSTLRQGPAHQQPVHTYHESDDRKASWWEFFCAKIREGRQGYVVAPRVDAGDDDVANVQQLYEALTNGELSDFRVGLLHGRLSPNEKTEVMQSFANGEYQVLVTTQVIEVGINVPNATVMTIEDGHLFGLSQLHQLRGRVRRGIFPGYVCVFGQPGTEHADEKLTAFVEHLDGFKLAEIDFNLRGPGDLFGVRQHGMPPLRVADLRSDRLLLEQARTDAQAMMDHDPGLNDIHFIKLRKQVLKRYGTVLDMGDVG